MSIVKQSLVGASGQGGDYTIDDSLRFRRSASAYLNRTPASSSNRKTWTYSAWVKLGEVENDYTLFAAGDYAQSQTRDTEWISINGNAKLFWGYAKRVSGTYTAQSYVYSQALFRDPSAWYHVVVVKDVSNTTTADKVIFYVNGVRQGVDVTSAVVDTNGRINDSTAEHKIGVIDAAYAGGWSDGYITEVNFIDGQALDPTDFGEYDDNGTWKAKKYTGTYGTNGFYLNGVGVTDQSGNGNNWTNNNLNLSTSTATTYDQMKDTPSLVDENAGNFATLNPLQRANGTLSNGNLSFVSTTLRTSPFIGTISVDVVDTDGYWYEVIPTQGGVTNYYIGFAKDGYEPYNATASTDAGFLGFLSNGHTANEGTYIGTDSSAAWVNGDVVGIGVKSGGIYVSINGVPANSGNPLITGKTGSWKPWLNHVGSSSTTFNGSINFGQQPFAYTPPTGFKKYNTFNLPDSTIEKGSDYFNTVLYTGNGSTQSVSGVGFQPDFLWLRRRDSAENHGLHDAVRGSTNFLISNATASEFTRANSVTSFDSDGFSLGDYSNINFSGSSMVGWNWLANGSGVSNTDGAITSTVSANTTAGFSIVSYTGNGGTGSIGHGLGVTPSLVIIKNRNNGSSYWPVFGSVLGNNYLTLNTTSAQAAGWTSVSSSVITFNSYSSWTTENGSGHVAYCFAPVEGYSAFGSYTGNGSADGPFVYTGFRPAFVLFKRTDNSFGADWIILDTSRDTYNSMLNRLNPNGANAENATLANLVDYTSNGFKIRSTLTGMNVNGGTIIYMAFAENPFKNANAR